MTEFIITLQIQDNHALISLTGPKEFIQEKGISQLPSEIKEYVSTLAMTLEHLKMVSNNQKTDFTLKINEKTILTSAH